MRKHRVAVFGQARVTARTTEHMLQTSADPAPSCLQRCVQQAYPPRTQEHLELHHHFATHMDHSYSPHKAANRILCWMGTTKTTVPKKSQKCGNTGSLCLDKPVLGQDNVSSEHYQRKKPVLAGDIRSMRPQSISRPLGTRGGNGGSKKGLMYGIQMWKTVPSPGRGRPPAWRVGDATGALFARNGRSSFASFVPQIGGLRYKLRPLVSSGPWHCPWYHCPCEAGGRDPALLRHSIWGSTAVKRGF